MQNTPKSSFAYSAYGVRRERGEEDDRMAKTGTASEVHNMSARARALQMKKKAQEPKQLMKPLLHQDIIPRDTNRGNDPVVVMKELFDAYQSANTLCISAHLTEPTSFVSKIQGRFEQNDKNNEDFFSVLETRMPTLILGFLGTGNNMRVCTPNTRPTMRIAGPQSSNGSEQSVSVQSIDPGRFSEVLQETEYTLIFSDAMLKLYDAILVIFGKDTPYYPNVPTSLIKVLSHTCRLLHDEAFFWEGDFLQYQHIFWKNLVKSAQGVFKRSNTFRNFDYEDYIANEMIFDLHMHYTRESLQVQVVLAMEQMQARVTDLSISKLSAEKQLKDLQMENTRLELKAKQSELQYVDNYNTVINHFNLTSAVAERVQLTTTIETNFASTSQAVLSPLEIPGIDTASFSVTGFPSTAMHMTGNTTEDSHNVLQAYQDTLARTMPNKLTLPPIETRKVTNVHPPIVFSSRKGDGDLDDEESDDSGVLTRQEIELQRYQRQFQLASESISQCEHAMGHMDQEKQKIEMAITKASVLNDTMETNRLSAELAQLSIPYQLQREIHEGQITARNTAQHMIVELQNQIHAMESTEIGNQEKSVMEDN